MIYSSIHNVMSIEITETKSNTTSNGDSYSDRKIIVTTADGKALELVLFADHPKFLEVK
jgi:ketosteroid isomerase-like protein